MAAAAILEKIQMAISPQPVVRSTSCLVIWWGFQDGGSNGAIFDSNKFKMAADAILDNFEWPYLCNGSRSTYSAHRAVIFAIAQLSCCNSSSCVLNAKNTKSKLKNRFCTLAYNNLYFHCNILPDQVFTLQNISVQKTQTTQWRFTVSQHQQNMTTSCVSNKIKNLMVTEDEFLIRKQNILSLSDCLQHMFGNTQLG